MDKACGKLTPPASLYLYGSFARLPKHPIIRFISHTLSFSHCVANTHTHTHTPDLNTVALDFCDPAIFFFPFLPRNFLPVLFPNEGKWRMGLWGLQAATLVVPQQGSLGSVGASGLLSDTRGFPSSGAVVHECERKWKKKEQKKANWREKLGVKREGSKDACAEVCVRAAKSRKTVLVRKRASVCARDSSSFRLTSAPRGLSSQRRRRRFTGPGWRPWNGDKFTALELMDLKAERTSPLFHPLLFPPSSATFSPPAHVLPSSSV